MKTTARAVVIGGGVVGVSTLYHLAKMGWSDVVLLERKELTSGSTWHAAGLLPLFNLSYSVGKLHQYSVELYPSLEAETGLHAGFSQVTNIRLATTQDRMDEYHYYAGVARTIGVDVNFLTPDQVKDIWPLANMDGVIGAIQHPEDGYIQPADLTQALAKGARQYGATIYRNTVVTAITQQANGAWLVSTDQGDITCEHVISCSGNFARQTGAMVGLDIPVIPVEHQYIVTEQHPAIMERKKAGLPEMGVLRESDASYYMREEAGGLLLGPYEVGAPACYVDGPAANSEYELFPDALERLEPYILAAMARVPAFGEVGIKKVYNGAIAYTPDGSPIVGPAWGLKNFWLNEGHSFGVTAAGGAGWQLAHWIVDGEPTIDMMGVDPRRFGDYAGRGFLIAKNEEAYAKVFTVHYPDEEREAARALRRTPCYDRMKAKGAVFGSVFGWERPNWFAPEGYHLTEADLDKPDVLLNHNHPVTADDALIQEKWSFRRSNYFEHVGNECRHVSEKVGLQDMSAFAKCEISGLGAEAWLDQLLTNAVPKKVGRVSLSYLLTSKGGVRSEFTVYKMASQRYYLVSAGAYERHDHDYLKKAMPTDGSVSFERLTTSMGVLVLAGPRSRDVLAKLTDTDLSSASFPWLTGKKMSIGLAQVDALRVNFIGELGWEIHHPIEMQNYIFDVLFEAGAEFDIKPFGIRAMTSMALEKSYKLIPRELSIEYSAFESGLDRFISLKKQAFFGRDALLSWKEKGLSNTLVTLEVHGVSDADARGSEAIYQGDQLVGRTTSGGYGWRVKKSLALAMIRPDVAIVGAAFEIAILGVRYKATIIEDSPFDPENNALRG
ncbi:MAG: FAD-dependent oxidoreductase [Chakrabartia sp.]